MAEAFIGVVQYRISSEHLLYISVSLKQLIKLDDMLTVGTMELSHLYGERYAMKTSDREHKNCS